MSKTFFPILSTMKRTLLSLCDQANPLWLHHILVFFGNMHCLLSKNFFEPQEKNVSYETRTLQWKVWFTTVILIFFYCSSLVAIWPQCHALHEKPLFERWFICVCVFFSFFFFSQIEFFNQNDDVLPFSQFPPERFLYLNVGLISLDVWLVDKIYFFFYFFELCFYLHLNKVWQTRDMILGKPWLSMKINSVQKTGTEVNTHFDAFLFVFCGLVWFIDVLVIIVV